jgi:hypothetical protein
MKKLNILLWVNILVVLVSCEHKPEEPSALTLTFSVSQTNCYEGDTLNLSVTVNDKPYSGSVRWNRSEIVRSADAYTFIVPPIQSDSISTQITATVESQTSSQTIQISKRAFKFPLVSYQNTIQPLLTGNCNFSGCHANGSRAGKVELSCYDSTLKSVAPYNSSASLLYIALVKTDPLRVMPPAGRLHDYKIEDVRVWIEQGAKDN